MQSIHIFHNPQCSKSRDVLRFLKDAGVEPEVTLYLQTGWTRDVLLKLKEQSGLGWEIMLRNDAKKTLQAAIEENDDEVIIQQAINDPGIIERPFVITSKGVRLCRPITQLFEIVDTKPASPWLTERGERII